MPLTPKPEGVRGTGSPKASLGRELTLQPQRVQTHSPFVWMPAGPWPGKAAQMDVSAVHLMLNLKQIFSSERRRPQAQRA